MGTVDAPPPPPPATAGQRVLHLRLDAPLPQPARLPGSRAALEGLRLFVITGLAALYPVLVLAVARPSVFGGSAALDAGGVIASWSASLFMAQGVPATATTPAAVLTLTGAGPLIATMLLVITAFRAGRRMQRGRPAGAIAAAFRGAAPAVTWWVLALALWAAGASLGSGPASGGLVQRWQPSALGILTALLLAAIPGALGGHFEHRPWRLDWGWRGLGAAFDAAALGLLVLIPLLIGLFAWREAQHDAALAIPAHPADIAALLGLLPAYALNLVAWAWANILDLGVLNLGGVAPLALLIPVLTVALTVRRAAFRRSVPDAVAYIAGFSLLTLAAGWLATPAVGVAGAARTVSGGSWGGNPGVGFAVAALLAAVGVVVAGVLPERLTFTSAAARALEQGLRRDPVWRRPPVPGPRWRRAGAAAAALIVVLGGGGGLLIAEAGAATPEAALRDYLAAVGRQDAPAALSDADLSRVARGFTVGATDVLNATAFTSMLALAGNRHSIDVGSVTITGSGETVTAVAQVSTDGHVQTQRFTVVRSHSNRFGFIPQWRVVPPTDLLDLSQLPPGSLSVDGQNVGNSNAGVGINDLSVFAGFVHHLALDPGEPFQSAAIDVSAGATAPVDLQLQLSDRGRALAVAAVKAYLEACASSTTVFASDAICPQIDNVAESFGYTAQGPVTWTVDDSHVSPNNIQTSSGGDVTAQGEVVYSDDFVVEQCNACVPPVAAGQAIHHSQPTPFQLTLTWTGSGFTAGA